METGRKKQTKRQKNLFTMTSGGFVIVVTNNSLNDTVNSILWSLPILKTLGKHGNE